MFCKDEVEFCWCAHPLAVAPSSSRSRVVDSQALRVETILLRSRPWKKLSLLHRHKNLHSSPLFEKKKFFYKSSWYFFLSFYYLATLLLLFYFCMLNYTFVLDIHTYFKEDSNNWMLFLFSLVKDLHPCVEIQCRKFW